MLCEVSGAEPGGKGGRPTKGNPATVAGLAESLGVPERTARHRVALAKAKAGRRPKNRSEAWIDSTPTYQEQGIDHTHVLRVKETWRKFGALTHQDRPWFRDAYNEIANKSKLTAGR